MIGSFRQSNFNGYDATPDDKLKRARNRHEIEQ